jgi:hypothetical protein
VVTRTINRTTTIKKTINKTVTRTRTGASKRTTGIVNKVTTKAGPAQATTAKATTAQATNAQVTTAAQTKATTGIPLTTTAAAPLAAMVTLSGRVFYDLNNNDKWELAGWSLVPRKTFPTMSSERGPCRRMMSLSPTA